MLTSVTLSPDEAAAAGGGGGLLPDGETTKANSSGVSSGSGIDVSITFGCAAKKCETTSKRPNDLNSLNTCTYLYSHFAPLSLAQVLTYSFTIFKAAEFQSTPYTFGPAQKVHFGMLGMYSTPNHIFAYPVQFNAPPLIVDSDLQITIQAS